MESNILEELANKFQTDKGTSKGATHGYTEEYFSHFQHLQNKPINVLEIGAGEGYSLLMWDSFFTHSKSKIVCIDNGHDKEVYKHQTPNFNKTKISLYNVDQGNRLQLTEWINKMNIKFDIIIDDGAHRSKEQQISFGVLFPFVKPGGFYVIEDLAFMDQSSLERTYSKNTLKLIRGFIKGRSFDSEYMTSDEIKYLIEQTSNSFLYNDHKNIVDQLWILEKK